MAIESSFDPVHGTRTAERDPMEKTTTKLPKAPPLERRVSVAAPDLSPFDLSDAARALAATLDGTRTLQEILDRSPGAMPAVAELYDARVLVFEPV